MRKSLRIVALAGALTVSAGLLSSCGGDDTSAGDEAGSSRPTPVASISPSTVPTSAPSAVSDDIPEINGPEDFTELQIGVPDSELVNDPTWVSDSQYIHWPKEWPVFEIPQGSELTQDQLIQAVKESITFATQIGWNDSLMSKGSDFALASSAIAPYMNANAMKRVEKVRGGYERTNKRIKNGLNIPDFVNGDTPESSDQKIIDDFGDWYTLSGLLSYAVPYFSPLEIGGVREDGTPNNDTKMQYGISGVTISENGYIVVSVILARDFNISGTSYLEQGEDRFTKQVSFYLKRNPADVTGIPFVIDDWETQSLDQPDFAKLYEAEDGALLPGPLPYFWAI